MKPLRFFIPYEVISIMRSRYNLQAEDILYYVITSFGDYGFNVIYTTSKPSKYNGLILDRFKEILIYNQSAEHVKLIDRYLTYCLNNNKSLRVGISTIDSKFSPLTGYKDYILILNIEG